MGGGWGFELEGDAKVVIWCSKAELVKILRNYGAQLPVLPENMKVFNNEEGVKVE